MVHDAVIDVKTLTQRDGWPAKVRVEYWSATPSAASAAALVTSVRRLARNLRPSKSGTIVA